jgi:hypothetical protein
MRARSTRKAERLEKSRALQRVLYRSAKQDPNRGLHALYDKVARSDVLARAWGEVRANRGAPGVDGITIEAVEFSGVEAFLDGIAGALKDRTYRASPLRRVEIPRPGSRGRPGQGCGGFRLPGLSLPQGGVLEVTRAVLLPALAVPAGHGGHTGADQGCNGPALRGVFGAGGGRRGESGAPAVGSVLPLGQLCPVLLLRRPLRPRTSGHLREHQARTLGARVEQPVRLGVVPGPRGVPPQRRRPVRDCACLAVNGVGKPGAGEPHARFDRGPLAKRQPWRAVRMHPPGNRWD